MGAQVVITMPDGMKKPILKDSKLKELADQWDKEAVAAQVDGVLLDLSRRVENDATISFISISIEEGIRDITPFCISCHGPGSERALPKCQTYLWSLH